MLQLELLPQEFNPLRDYIEAQCGICIGQDKAYLIQARLTNLVIEAGFRSFGEFLRHVTTKGNTALRDKIVDAMTTNETLWFRDSAPWVALRDKILPNLEQRLSAGSRQPLRLWSAACSTGQEPYSIAMLIDDYCLRNPSTSLLKEPIEIIATDISPSALYLAMNGRHDRVSMSRGLLGDFAPFKERYFQDVGRFSVLSTDIRRRVTFKRFNLLDPFDNLGRFHLIFLRNVAIYFSDEVKGQIFEKISRALLPEGTLLLGSSETILDLNRKFQAQKHGRAVLYALA
jgi:chemotaxis protein methyltransferase CheR